ncbi:GRB2-associated-binding protein 1-like isoform X2 [Lineus longissimus]|uniref:GRB2-associated-binding protein 1-like isoform X2 n=1 Tax=Lineus longissimus TaxID=88925 RepID=UPI00315CD17D
MSSEEVIVKGWLVKSPPERKSSRIAWRFVFRAAMVCKHPRLSSIAEEAPYNNYKKWRRRYFVLHKPLGSLPGYFALDYYEDETCRRKTGSIDLELTEQIISSLDSSHYAHLFAIKTKFKKKDRTYYLAVDSENEMNKWVECLCQVCGLKPEDVPDADQPAAPPVDSVDGSVDVRTVQPHTGMGAQQPETPSSIAEQNHAGSYVRLDVCVSTKNDPAPVSSPEFDRQSVDSIPDTPPPPIPLPVDPSPTTDNAFTFEPNLYSVPPRRPDIPVSEGPQDWYDVPPPQSAVFSSNLRRDSTSSSAKRDSSVRGSTQSTLSEQSSMSGPNEIYDVPPTRYQLDEVAKKTSEVRLSAPEDMYDYPPSRIDNSEPMAPVIPDAPPRPPRPAPGKPAQIETRLAYQNVPPNSMAHPANRKPDLTEFKQRSFDDIYDFPKPQPNNGCLSMSPPPGNVTSNVTTHNYINASTTVDNDDDDAFAPADNSNNNTKLGNDLFSVVPTTNRNGDLHLQALRDSAVNDNIYQIPPSNAPITSARPQVTTRATPTKKPAAKGTLPEDTYAIYPTARTRSFKKERVPTPPMNRSTKTQAAISEIGIPTPTRIGSDDSSSSDDDDSLSEQLIAKASRRSHANSLTLPYNHKPPQQKKEIQYLDLDLSGPKGSGDEIQYLDLDLQATPEKKVIKRSPKLSKPVTAGNVSPTEYKEIDFLKTHALNETRKTLESEHKRKNSDAVAPI